MIVNMMLQTGSNMGQLLRMRREYCPGFQQCFSIDHRKRTDSVKFGERGGHWTDRLRRRVA
jgi:hypothetical protein